MDLAEKEDERTMMGCSSSPEHPPAGRFDGK